MLYNGIILEIDRRLKQSLHWIYHLYQGGGDFCCYCFPDFYWNLKTQPGTNPHTLLIKRGSLEDVPGSPMIKTLPARAGGTGLIPGRAAKSPLASQLKNQNINNRSNIVTNSMKTFKMVHNKNIYIKKEGPCWDLS